MNFSQYLNELRINYIVEELKTNRIIRKHTIAAIADDLGYNNSESFTNNDVFLELSSKWNTLDRNTQRYRSHSIF